MSKQVKIVTTILMVIAIIATISNVVYGSGILNSLASANPDNVSGATQITKLGSTIVGILQVVGIVVAVVVLLVIGIKYMMGSAEEKAEYKKVMVPYVVGALLIFAATSIVKIVYNMFSGISV